VLLAQQKSKIIGISPIYHGSLSYPSAYDWYGELSYEHGLSNHYALRLGVSGYIQNQTTKIASSTITSRFTSIVLNPELRYYPLGDKKRFYLSAGPTFWRDNTQTEFFNDKGEPVPAPSSKNFNYLGMVTNTGYQHIIASRLVLQANVGIGLLGKPLEYYYQLGLMIGYKL
jgi:Protein of unknown function (DUF3575)